MNGQKKSALLKPSIWQKMAKTWYKLAWLKLVFGSKLLVYRHAAEKLCHMPFVCLKLTYHRGAAKNTLRLPET